MMDTRQSQVTATSKEKTIEVINKLIKDQKFFICFVINNFDFDSVESNGQAVFNTSVISRGFADGYLPTLEKSLTDAFADSLQDFFAELEREKSQSIIQ